MEAPLLEVDDLLSDFARRNGLRVSGNHHGWPERSLTWGGSLRRRIQLFLRDPDTLTFSLWLCASEDRGGRRYWKHRCLVEGEPLWALARRLPVLLELGLAEVNSWTHDDLEVATGPGA